MKFLKTISLFTLFLALIFIFTPNTDAQNLADIEGTTNIIMNSTSGQPHLRLVEDDTSPGGSARLEFRHEGVSDRFEMRTFLNRSDQTWSLYYNSNLKLAYDALSESFGINAGFTPDGTLHVRSESNSSFPTLLLEEDNDGQFSRVFFTNSNFSDKWALSSRISSTHDHTVGFFYNGSPRMVYNEDNAGLGIGTDQPSEKLHVKSTGNDGVRIEGDGTGDARLWISNTAGNHFLFDDFSDANAFAISSANDFKINANGTERLRINETGEIGLNTIVTTASSRQIQGYTDDKLYCFYGENDNTETAVGLHGRVISTGVQNKFGVQGQATGSAGTGAVIGVFGIASTSPANSHAVYANGDISYTGSLNMVSDFNLKKDIENFASVLDKVMQLNPTTYEFKHTEYPFLNLAQEKQYGFIAQEVQQIFPEIVESSLHSGAINGSEDVGNQVELLSMSYIELIPVLTKAIQEQQNLITQLQQQVADLQTSDK